MKFSGVTFVVHLFHPRSKIRGVPRFARARGSWLWSVTSSSWILSGSNRTPPQFAGAVEMCWEEAPGRQTPPRGRPRLQGLACSSLTGRDGCATHTWCWRAGRRPSHRECTRPPTFQREGTKPSAQRRQQRQGVPAARQMRCHQGALSPGGIVTRGLKSKRSRAVTFADVSSGGACPLAGSRKL